MSSTDFWSRRRAAVEAEARAEDAETEAALAAREEAELDARSDEEVLAELGLEAPELLETPEQVRVFLAEAVPQRLRTRALRRLWRLNPVLANVDGLVDYGEDYTDAATVVENMQTVYKVGKGMFDRLTETEVDAPEPVVPEEEAEPEMAQEQATEVVLASVPEIDTRARGEAAEIETVEPVLAARRMRFRFEEAGERMEER